MHRLALLALTLSLAACADTPGGDSEALAPAQPEGLENATLDLQATGIVIPPQGGFEQLDVPFGSNRDATTTTLANLLGASTANTTPNGDCGLTTLEFDGVTLSFNAEDQFVGYYATDPFVPGMTRAELLEDATVALAEESTLGEEFTIGQGEAVISGLFASEDGDAAVEALWAGENCITR